MDTFDCIKKRRSIREFSKREVDRRDLYKILEAGTLAPSSGNIQNWRFIVTNKKIDVLANSTDWPETFDNVSTAIIVCSTVKNILKEFGERGKLYASQNIGAAIENMLLEATNLGVDGLWVGAFTELEIRRAFLIPEDIGIHAIILLGYKAKRPTKVIRMPVGNVTYFEIWDEREAKRPFFPLSKHIDKIKKVIVRRK